MFTEQQLEEMKKRHQPVQYMIRHSFGATYWKCPDDGTRTALDAPKPEALCDAMKLIKELEERKCSVNSN